MNRKWQLAIHSPKAEPSPRVTHDLEEWRQVPPTALDRPEIREVLVKALVSLDPDSRDAFVVHDIHGFSTCEASLVLGISCKSMRQNLRQARLMLTDILLPEFKGNAQLEGVKTL